MVFLIILAVMVGVVLIGALRVNHCPKCGAETDDTMHGYSRRFEHCHECGWCSSSPNCHARKPEVWDE